jgi:hypothetical protein
MDPYPAGYPGRRAEGPAIMSWFPVAFRLPAFAFRPSDSRRGIGPSSRSAYRARSPDLDGVTAFRTHELQPGWVPPLPRGRRRSSRLSEVLNRRLPLLNGQSLHPATSIHQRGPHYGTSTEVHAIHPSGFPLACDPRMERASLGFPPSFEPRRPRAGRRTSGWGQAAEHGPGTTYSTSVEPPVYVFARQRATSRRNIVGG